MGRFTTYTYLSDGSRRVQTVNTVLGATSYGYDATTGEIATTTDALNHTTSMAYDAGGHLTSQATADGYTESWSYNTAGQVSTHTDKAGTQDQTNYDAFGRGLMDNTVAGYNTSVARTTVNTYDSAGRGILVGDAAGYPTQVTLDPAGRTLVTTDALGNTTRNVFDLAGQLTDTFDGVGAHTHYAYNSRGWVTATTDPRGGVSSYTFDAAGNLTVAQDPLGHAATTTFDALDRVSTQTDPLNHTVTTTYWADGTVKTVTDARGFVTSITNDLEHKQILTTAAAGTGLAQTTTQLLDADGDVIATQDALGHTTSYTLDTVNQVVVITDPLLHVTTLVRDAMSRVTQETDGLNNSTTYTLDKLGEAVKTTDATGHSTQAVFDGLGRTVAALDAYLQVTAVVFDPAGNTIWNVDADGNAVRTQVDADGRPVALVDALGNQTNYEYDLNGNQTKMIDPSGNSATWSFDAANRLTGHTDRLGRSEAYTYLNNDLLSTEVWKDSGGATVNTLAYTYNEDDQLLTAGDASGTYTYMYDALGREVTQKDVWNLTLTMGYDAANRLTTIADSLGGLVTDTYDNANRVTERQFTDTNSHALSAGYSYNAGDELTGVSRYSDASETTLVGSTSYGYDAARRVTSDTHKNGGGTTLDALTYTYDNDGRVTAEVSTLGGSTSYGYDSAGQLTLAGTTSFVYDAEGNRDPHGFVTLPGNELQTDGTWNYAYDAEGNETQKANIASGQVWLYSYDNADRLTKAEHKPSATGAVDERIVYKYDVFGDRIEKDVDPTGGGSYTTQLRMAYDPSGNAWADLDGTSGNALLTRRLYADAVDALFARIGASSGTAWYLDDPLGSVRDIAGSTGSLIDTLEYNGFGGVASESSPSNGDRYAWTGRERDVETGLQYNRARYYDPGSGRWMSQDPLGFDAGDSNLYRYVNNASSSELDPTGLWAIERNNSGTARAISEKGDTIQGLADLIGLDIGEREAWLSHPEKVEVSDGTKAAFKDLKDDTPLAAKQEFSVPNTVYMLWAGDLGAAGRWAVDWNEDRKSLETLGFKVVQDEIYWVKDKRVLLRVGPITFRGGYKTNMGWGAVLSKLSTLSAKQELQGFVFTGHGDADGIGLDQRSFEGSSIEFINLRENLKYNLGFAILNSCFSNSEPGNSIVSKSNGVRFGGSTGYLLPPFDTWHPRHLFSNGQQGTRPLPPP
jgi:RHS repeat-associated protein